MEEEWMKSGIWVIMPMRIGNKQGTLGQLYKHVKMWKKVEKST